MFMLLFPFIFLILIRYLVSKDVLPFCRWSLHLFCCAYALYFYEVLFVSLALFPKQLDPYLKVLSYADILQHSSFIFLYCFLSFVLYIKFYIFITEVLHAFFIFPDFTVLKKQTIHTQF